MERGRGQISPAVFDNNFGNVLIWFQIAYGLGFLFAGRMIDKLGTKTGYALAIGIWALASMSHSAVTSVAGFCVARVFLGLGESGNFPAAIKAVSEWFPTQERGKAIGLFNSGTNASALIAPALIAFVTARYGWRAAFLTTGSFGIIWLVLWLLFPYNRLRRGATQTQANLDAQLLNAEAHHGGSRYAAIFSNRGLYAFAIAKGLTDGVWWFYLFLSAAVSQPQLRALAARRLLVHRNRVHDLVGRLHRRWIALRLAHEPGPLGE